MQDKKDAKFLCSFLPAEQGAGKSSCSLASALFTFLQPSLLSLLCSTDMEKLMDFIFLVFLSGKTAYAAFVSVNRVMDWC